MFDINPWLNAIDGIEPAYGPPTPSFEGENLRPTIADAPAEIGNLEESCRTLTECGGGRRDSNAQPWRRCQRSLVQTSLMRLGTPKGQRRSAVVLCETM